jgi:alpha-mannosidase
VIDIIEVESTLLFVGTQRSPLQLHRVTLVSRSPHLPEAQPVTLRIEGSGVTTPEPVAVPPLSPGEQRVVDVPVAVDPGIAEGTRIPVTVFTESPAVRAQRPAEVVVAEPGWTMVMVPHFHYDPFWWNTQAGYLSTWDDLPPDAQEPRKPGQAVAFELVRAHLDLARQDPDYKFVLAELDYLKPYWDAHPEDRSDLRALIAGGRVEVVGGMYNEPNTNLTSLESTIRNAVLGMSFQRDVVGAAPRVGWMLDVFGHDPALPAVLADAGLTAISYARGPFHLWGPAATVGDETGMQFASEFEWIAPDGRGLLSGYLAHHYPAGWRLNELASLDAAEQEVYAQFRDLKRAAATRNVLLPVGYNHVVPARWTTDIHRDWNSRYVWPRFVCGLPGEFFARVREDARRRRLTFSPQSRDMNPVYPGKDVSYIDVKQAQRAAETAILEAERLATLAHLLGARYPAEAIDKAWRQLCFCAHHDGITGVTSDQVYLDLLGGWRESYELGAAVRTAALRHLATMVDTSGAGHPLIVTNAQAWERGDVVSAVVELPQPGHSGIAVLDDTGRSVPALIADTTLHDDGTLAAATVSFVAHNVPATGYRTFRLHEANSVTDNGWRPADGYRAENDIFLVEADPGRGGALSRILDKRSGKELVRTGAVAGGLVLDDEYSEHPEFRKGPWHIIPRGTRQTTETESASVRAEICPAGQRLVCTCRLGDLLVTTEVTAWHGLDRLEFRTRVDGWHGQDQLLRVRFPFAVAGARPVYEVGNAVIGRTFGYTEVDVAEHPFVLDSPAYTWAGLSSVVRIAFPDGTRHAIGVAEIVADGGDGPDQPTGVRGLVAALAQQGVTATTSRPDGARCGSLRLDSNLPDVRLSIGGPAQNPFTARVLAAAGDRYAALLDEQLATTGRARLWVPAAGTRSETWRPGADLRGERALPVLIVAGRDGAATAAAVGELVADLADASICVDQSAGADGPATAEPLEDFSVAVLNRGTPGVVVEPDGTLYLSLMRACSGWPSGTWIDPPRRTAPDGSSFALQHWTHTFEYGLVCGPGDWRDAGFVRSGQAYNSRFAACLTDPHSAQLPPAASLLRVEPDNVVLTVLKRHGNALASGRPPAPDNTVTVRCYEAHGRATDARIHCLLPLRAGARADIEERPREPLDASDGTLRLALGPAATVTATVEPAVAVAADSGVALGPSREVAQPVFARYWLHNRGTAPMGHHPAMVYLEPRTVEVTGPTTVRLTVSSTGPATGRVELLVPPGVVATSPEDLRYDLDDGYRRFEVLLRPGPRAGSGVGHLRAQITDDSGQTVEDVVALRLGDVDGGHRPLRLRVSPAALTLTPGTSQEVCVRLTNRCLNEVCGEAVPIAPFGTWNFIGPWTQGFTVAADGAETTLRYQVQVPPGTPPMDSWLMVKVMAFGTVDYTPAIPLRITAAGGDQAGAVVREPVTASIKMNAQVRP